jgi:hypothetical protein
MYLRVSDGVDITPRAFIGSAIAGSTATTPSFLRRQESRHGARGTVPCMSAHSHFARCLDPCLRRGDRCAMTAATVAVVACVLTLEAFEVNHSSVFRKCNSAAQESGVSKVKRPEVPALRTCFCLLMAS